MSEPIEIRVWSDYVCPWCYIGLNEIERAIQPFQVKLEWEPYFLRPDTPETGWELPDHIKAKMSSPDNPLQQRAKALGIQLKERTRVPSTRRAHEATEYARTEGKLDAFHSSVLRRYWSEGADLHEWSVLQAAATEAGLDPEKMKSEVEAGHFTAEVERRVREANENGIHAVPSFVFEGEYLVQGAQTAEVFGQVLTKLKAPAR